MIDQLFGLPNYFTTGYFYASLIISITLGLAVGMVRYETVRRLSRRLAKGNLVFLEINKL